jgi:hypothetical protein
MGEDALSGPDVKVLLDRMLNQPAPWQEAADLRKELADARRAAEEVADLHRMALKLFNEARDDARFLAQAWLDRINNPGTDGAQRDDEVLKVVDRVLCGMISDYDDDEPPTEEKAP